jgi:hypothetical protein
MQSGFSVQTDTLTGGTKIACEWQAAPPLRNVEYMLLLLVLLPLDLLWVFAIYDSVDYVRRIDIITPPPPPPSAQYLQVGGMRVPVPWTALHPPRMPLALTPSSTPTSAMSHRHEGFAGALTLATQLAWTLIVLSILFGLGANNFFWHETWSAYDAAAVYSVMGVSGAMAAALWLLPVFPVVMAGWGDSVVLMLLWLVSTGRPFVPTYSFIMLIASATVAASAVKHALLMVTGRLWPYRTYRRNWFVWTVVLCVLAAWSLWIYAFYTVRLITLSWRAETDGVWAVCGLALVVLAFVVQMVMRKQHMMMLSLQNASREHIEAKNTDLIGKLRDRRSDLWKASI